MRTSRRVGLVFLATAALAQQQPVEIRTFANSISRHAQFATLEFKPEQQKQ